MTDTHRPTIFGIPFDPISLRQAVELTGKALTGGRLFRVATAGPEFLMASRENRQFAEVLQQTDLTLADGFGVIIAARLLGKKGLHRVPGMEYLQELMAFCSDADMPIFLFGAMPGVAEDAARKLTQSLTKLHIAGIESGFREWLRVPDAYVCWRIRKSGARLLLVALGAPQQELWIDRNRDKFGQVRVAIGVGGAFDFWAGRVKRAPSFVRNVGLEWVWRMLQEPRKRTRRIFNATWKFLGAVLQERRENHV